MQAGSEIVAAMDRDEAGRKLADLVGSACADVLQNGTFIKQFPEGVKDYNDVLRSDRCPAMVRMRALIPA